VIAPKALAAGGMVLAGWLVATVLRHGGKAVYDLPSWAVALGVVAALGSFVGWALVIRSRGWLGVGVAVVGSLIVASIVSIPVIGVLLLVGGVALMARSSQSRPDRLGLAGGLLVALALPVAAVVAADGPVVECHADGSISTSSSLFRPSSSGTGSGDAVQGRLDQGGRHYTYRCAGGRLVRFTAR
jgi:hypothetical protein